MDTSNPENYVGYCGIFCNACGIRQGKIKNAVEDLRKIIASYGFDKIMPELSEWEPSLKHYKEFEQVMDGLVKFFGECPSCLEGGGDPNCKVRSCAQEKNLRTCVECIEAKDCENLAPYRKYYEEALKAFKENDIKKYAEEMQKKVDNGYCIS